MDILWNNRWIEQRKGRLRMLHGVMKGRLRISIYRVSQVNCKLTKRRISASRNDKIILKKVQESSVNAIFSRTNLISLCLIVCPPAKFKMRTYFHLKCKFSIIVLCHSSFNLLSFLNALSQKSGNSLELKIN